MQKVFREIGVTVPRDWRPKADDGVRLNLAPLAAWIADRKLRESIGQMCAKTISRELTAGCG
jgi:hypothetical protein